MPPHFCLWAPHTGCLGVETRLVTSTRGFPASPTLSQARPSESAPVQKAGMAHSTGSISASSAPFIQMFRSIHSSISQRGSQMFAARMQPMPHPATAAAARSLRYCQASVRLY